MKPNARKVRRLGPGGSVIAGFAGATADAMTLLERLEGKIDAHPGQLLRAAVALAAEWRLDKYLRRLDAVLVVVDAKMSLTLTGGGDVLEPCDGIVGVGSGGTAAVAAARALVGVADDVAAAAAAEAAGEEAGEAAGCAGRAGSPEMGAEEMARRAMKIAADMCVYTNDTWVTEVIVDEEGAPSAAAEGGADAAAEEKEGAADALEATTDAPSPVTSDAESDGPVKPKGKKAGGGT